MISSTPQAVVRVMKVGDAFELRLPELLLVVRDRDLDRAWITLQRRAAAICGWATELGLPLPSIAMPIPGHDGGWNVKSCQARL